MENLTRHLRVVGPEQAGIHPQAGCYLVILKQVREGRIFDSVLKPGERPREGGLFKRLLNDDTAFISIPVSAATSLRHEFTSTNEHVTPGHSFEADYLLGFSVASPEQVAIRWVEDPIRKVEEEVRRVCDPLARTVEWGTLRTCILEDGGVRFFKDSLHDKLDDLKPFAQTYGIELNSIRMTLRLSRIDAQPDAKAAELERQQTIVQIGTAKRRAEMHAAHELKILEVEQKAEIRSLERPEELRDAAVASGKVALANVANNTHSSIDLVRAARDISSITGPSRVPITQRSLGANLGTAALNPAPDNKALAMVTEIAAVIETMAGDPARQRELFSALLHMIAEAYRGDDFDPKDVERYQKRAEDLLASDWGGSLGASQYKTLNRFRNFTVLQELLK
jgi:hypothetical protein